ncbi:unnamed protein product [Schistosoma turkestanicum]|nr:unnamed protein product [Schistosoma turkestanicum]
MVDVPLLTHLSETTDCSSSSCQTSSASEDSVPEGYLILTFDKKKKAVLKTAVFADVSDPRFADDYEDDDDDNECNNNGWPLHESKLSVHQQKNDGQLENEVTDVKGLLSKPLVISTETTDKTSSYTSCYGEAFWVGEDEINVKQNTTSSSWDLSPNNKTTQSLIRTSPLTCDTNLVTPISTLQSSTESWPLNTPQSNTTRLIGNFPYRRATIPINHLTRKHNHNTFYSHFQSKWPRALFNVHLSDHSKKMLRCDQCGKYYRNDYSLHHHICLKRKDVWKKGDVPSEMIDGQVMYFCPSCRKPFKWLGNLTRHFYVHTGQRFFRCDICSKEFFSAYQVKRHMNSHTGVRFKCEVCEKPFTCKYACAWHTRQHYAYSLK